MQQSKTEHQAHQKVGFSRGVNYALKSHWRAHSCCLHAWWKAWAVHTTKCFSTIVTMDETVAEGCAIVCSVFWVSLAHNIPISGLLLSDSMNFSSFWTSLTFLQVRIQICVKRLIFVLLPPPLSLDPDTPPKWHYTEQVHFDINPT
jgi:hypothetical protein